jgi:hypothetical protein
MLIPLLGMAALNSLLESLHRRDRLDILLCQRLVAHQASDLGLTDTVANLTIDVLLNALMAVLR